MTLTEDDFPLEGSVYLHNDSAEAVATQPDFRELDANWKQFEEAFEAVKAVMYEVELKIRVHLNGEVELLEVRGDFQDGVVENN